MRAVGAVLAVVVALGLVACGGSDDAERPRGTGSATTCLSPYDAGVSEHSVTVDGKRRTYLVAAPDERVLKGTLPVVYLFHGLGSTAADVIDYTGLAALADERKFLLVAPAAKGKDREWDVTGIAKGKGQDATFIDDVAREVGSQDCVDDDRQFAVGLSNGSGVSIALACQGPSYLKAYAGVATTFYSSACDGSPPASIIYFHGTGDEVVPFEGGKTPAFDVRAVPDVLADWADHDGCAADPTLKQIGKDVERSTWRDCDDQARLEAYVVDGGGHTWPDAAVPYPTLGKTTRTIDAATLILGFFGITKG
ncbi:alpha/beta hydrolase family esterase [Aeromicrobium sp. Root495]|uniref:alpha/beta hydrolase family esterase n=1 Tax=Aeromicrobium sp. Root495 TaxID=1736550 RepID=UPI000ACCBCB4|nr:PHB depolymerase family esterase [Aeromicrobium sp. Root495]